MRAVPIDPEFWNRDVAVGILIELEVPVIEAAAVSVPVMVWLPALFSVAEKVAVPFLSAELAGSTAWASVLVKCTLPE
jgi:hypothetical protein